MIIKISTHRHGRGFKCSIPFCTYICQKKQNMQHHMRDYHLPKCTECKLPIARADWNDHMAKHTAQATVQRNAVSKNLLAHRILWFKRYFSMTVFLRISNFLFRLKLYQKINARSRTFSIPPTLKKSTWQNMKLNIPVTKRPEIQTMFSCHKTDSSKTDQES